MCAVRGFPKRILVSGFITWHSVDIVLFALAFCFTGKSAKKFSRAVSIGNNQEFLSGEKVEQAIADSFRRLIQNAIICWNYLYLTQKITEAEGGEKRQELLTAVRNGSMAAWGTSIRMARMISQMKNYRIRSDDTHLRSWQERRILGEDVWPNSRF